MEKILLYGLNEDRKVSIKNLLKETGFQEIIFLQKEDACFKAGYLHELEGYAKEVCALKEAVHDVEFMMISGFDRDGINTLFSAFKSAGLSRPVTSALTEINKDWPLGDIINEVYEEHLLLTGQKNNNK